MKRIRKGSASMGLTVLVVLMGLAGPAQADLTRVGAVISGTGADYAETFGGFAVYDVLQSSSQGRLVRTQTDLRPDCSRQGTR